MASGGRSEVAGRITRKIPVIPPTPFVAFHVRIYYREPTWELYHGPRPEPLQASYDIEAVDAEHARRLALNEFRASGRDSGVGWVKEVVRVDVEVAVS
jgi:hypothetical protein